jgi:prephenate dehydrogenase
MIINIAGGTGIMGRTHKPIIENAGHKVILSGRETSPGLEEAAQMSDLTIVSVPIPAAGAMIKRLAPYCKAIMDFTGIKIQPIVAMSSYVPETCETGGMHPVYREFSPGATLAYCRTDKSGERCQAFINIMQNAGARIKIMSPVEHDRYMDVVQNQRAIMLKELITEMKAGKWTIKEAYEMSPMPTRIMLDLLARQVDEENKTMYEEMIEHNFFTRQRPRKQTLTPSQIREYFGDELKPAQERAKVISQLFNHY